MKALRKVEQKKIKGNIFLHSMPGLNEDLQDFMDQMNRMNIKRIICLAESSEVGKLSPRYMHSIYYGHHGDIYISYCPCPDSSVPSGDEALLIYKKGITEAFESLKAGNVLVHCRGGVGRTGTFTIILLRKMGFTFDEALRLTKNGGSNPEVSEQLDFSKNYKI